MTQKHTPAPWEIYNDPIIVKGKEFKRLVVSTPRNEAYDGGRSIAVLDEMDDVDIEANAHLIAAAPDLLSDLERAVELLQQVYGADAFIKEAQETINKAKGE